MERVPEKEILQKKMPDWLMVFYALARQIAWGKPWILKAVHLRMYSWYSDPSL